MDGMGATVWDLRVALTVICTPRHFKSKSLAKVMGLKLLFFARKFSNHLVKN
jgi:hypothetical protein